MNGNFRKGTALPYLIIFLQLCIVAGSLLNRVSMAFCYNNRILYYTHIIYDVLLCSERLGLANDFVAVHLALLSNMDSFVYALGFLRNENG